LWLAIVVSLLAYSIEGCIIVSDSSDESEEEEAHKVQYRIIGDLDCVNVSAWLSDDVFVSDVSLPYTSPIYTVKEGENISISVSCKGFKTRGRIALEITVDGKLWKKATDSGIHPFVIVDSVLK